MNIPQEVFKHLTEIEFGRFSSNKVWRQGNKWGATRGGHPTKVITYYCPSGDADVNGFATIEEAIAWVLEGEEFVTGEYVPVKF